MTRSSALVAAAAAFAWVSTMSVPAEGQTPAAGQGASAAQTQQAPGGRGGGRAGGRGGARGGGQGRGGGGIAPSELRAVPAETTAAKYRDPDWRAPRLSWGHPDLEGVFTSDDMRGIPTSRPAQFGDRESMSSEEFLQRARNDEASRDRAVNQESFLRNEFGVRTFGYTSLVVEPANGQMPAITAAAQARRAANAGVGTFGTRPLNSFEDFSLYDRCITRGVPGSITPVLYGNGVRIVQSPDTVTLTYEMIHDTRVIWLDKRPPLGDGIQQWIGDSRGWFEGDTLVVETRNFTDRTSVGGAPHTTRMKLTEWFTRVDPEMVEYRYRVEDPDTFVAPFTMRLMLTTQPDYENVGGILEYACHEGNTAVDWGLRGERHYEKMVEEALAKGEPVPPRQPRGMDVYGAPNPNAEVRDVNRSN